MSPWHDCLSFLHAIPLPSSSAEKTVNKESCHNYLFDAIYNSLHALHIYMGKAYMVLTARSLKGINVKYLSSLWQYSSLHLQMKEDEIEKVQNW